MTATVFCFVVSFLLFISFVEANPMVLIEIALDFLDLAIFISTRGKFWSIDEFCRWAELSFNIVTPDPYTDPYGFQNAVEKIMEAMREERERSDD